MNLIVLGEVKDATKELELFNTDCGILASEFGLNAHLFYKTGKVVVRQNLTEVHHLFDSSWDDDAIAFESDIHGTGGTQDINKRGLETVVITVATKLHDNYYQE